VRRLGVNFAPVRTLEPDGAHQDEQAHASHIASNIRLTVVGRDAAIFVIAPVRRVHRCCALAANSAHPLRLRDTLRAYISCKLVTVGCQLPQGCWRAEDPSVLSGRTLPRPGRGGTETKPRRMHVLWGPDATERHPAVAPSLVRSAILRAAHLAFKAVTHS
jgi:hypothetical protein